jgi:glutamate carboxypeptidase
MERCFLKSSFDFKELENFIKINSFTKNKTGVDKNGKMFQVEMEKLGFQTETFERKNIGNHLLFKSGGNGNRILLLGHLDTVFPKGEFETFSEDSEWVYGAGVCDMKGGNLVALNSLRNLKNEFEKIENIDFLLVSDEETGSDDSKIITKRIAKNYKYAFVFEASGKNGEVVVGRKGVGTFFLEISGKSAHAGNNYAQGIDANLEMAHKTLALSKLMNLEEGTTINIGKVEGGIGANTVSPFAKIVFEIRYTKVSERDRVLKGIDEVVKNSFVQNTVSKLSGGIQRDVMENSQEKIELLEKFEKLTGQKMSFESRGGVSDANITSSVGVLTIDGFGPFGDGDHTKSERALKNSFVERTELVSKLLSHFQTNQKF